MALPRRSAVFIADAQGLDFLNSVRPSGDGQIDWLENGAALLSWLEQAALEPLESIQRLRGNSSVAELDAVAAQARELREWFGQFVRARMGRPLDSSDASRPLESQRLLFRGEISEKFGDKALDIAYRRGIASSVVRERDHLQGQGPATGARPGMLVDLQRVAEGAP